MIVWCRVFISLGITLLVALIYGLISAYFGFSMNKYGAVPTLIGACVGGATMLLLSRWYVRG